MHFKHIRDDVTSLFFFFFYGNRNSDKVIRTMFYFHFFSALCRGRAREKESERWRARR